MATGSKAGGRKVGAVVLALLLVFEVTGALAPKTGGSWVPSPPTVTKEV